MEEIWKDIAGYEGLYQISNLGRVKSLERVVIYKTGRKQRYSEKVLKVRCNKCGYSYIKLWKNSKHKTLTIHRLVAEAFILNKYNKPQVNHIDGNKTNNCTSNLEWTTGSENIKHAIDNGLIEIKCGESSTSSRLTEKDVLEIRESNDLHRILAIKYGVTRQTIGDIKNRRRWKHI